MSAARSNRTSNSGSMALQVFKLPRRPRCKVNQALPHTRRRRPFCKQNERKSNFKTSRASSNAVKQSKTKEPAMHSTRKEKVCAQKFFLHRCLLLRQRRTPKTQKENLEIGTFHQNRNTKRFHTSIAKKRDTSKLYSPATLVSSTSPS